MMKIKYLFLLTTLTLTLSSCALLKPYESPVQQGTIITNKMIAQLTPGMNKTQVQYLLGAPDIVDPYHPNTWYYVYTFEKDHLPRAEKQLVLTFENKQLVKIAGDYQEPASS